MYTNYRNTVTKLTLLNYTLTKLWLAYSAYTNHSNNLTKLWLWRILWTPTTATTWPNSDSDIFCGHQLQQQQPDQTLTLRYSVDTNYTNNLTLLPSRHTGTSSERQQAFSQVHPAFCLNHYRTQCHDVDGSVFGWGWAAAAALTRICSLDQASVTSLMSSSLQQTPDPSAMILTNLPLPQFSNFQQVVRWLQNPRCLWTTYKSAFWHAMEHEPHSALLQSRALCSQWHPGTSGAWMLYPLPSLKMLTTVSAPPQRQHCTGHVCIHWHTVQ